LRKVSAVQPILDAIKRIASKWTFAHYPGASAVLIFVKPPHLRGPRECFD